MTIVEDLNAGWLHAPPHPRVCCHCLVLRDPAGVALVDTGIGLQDVRDPAGRVGEAAIRLAGFQFNPDDTAQRQLAGRGSRPADVTDIVVTHLDPDHAGGISDFPSARVHASAEERAAASGGDERYRPVQFERHERWVTYGPSAETWFGMEARRVDLGFSSPVLLVPLFGHTAGHCGVAVGQGERWVLHVGDAYYLRVELSDPDHPVGHVAAARAVDDRRRLESLERLRRLARDHGDAVRLLGYHDVQELPHHLGGCAGA
jgi:glyoxylase-like metal-dependent hydrolase (beta-lactamase superfamily II)